MATKTKNKNQEVFERLLTEDLIDLQQAAREMPFPTSYQTVFRWATRGVRKAKLATIKIGSKRVTSRQELTRFLVASQG